MQQIASDEKTRVRGAPPEPLDRPALSARLEALSAEFGGKPEFRKAAVELFQKGTG